MIGQFHNVAGQLEDIFKLLETMQIHKAAKVETPYPWCHGSPTREACAARGFCDRDPNCGE